VQHFISDLHLEESNPKVVEGLFTYLASLNAGDDLYILGDLFEVWIGDDFQDPLIESVEAAIRACPASVYLMHGNRDFLIGRDFASRANISLLDDPTRISIGGEPVLLMHGDSLCTRDEAYIAIRSQLRDPAFQAQLMAQPIDARRQIAANARQESTHHKQQTAMEIMDVTPNEVDRIMTAHGVRTLIHGHTHRPMDHQSEGYTGDLRRVVLGDWGESGWHAVADADGDLTLSSFPL
jgi:UDP-2,3-diacylglucosamine hydrolase